MGWLNDPKWRDEFINRLLAHLVAGSIIGLLGFALAAFAR